MKQASITSAFIIFFSLIGSSLHSQSLYEIKFNDKQNKQYTGFLVFFNETKAYMRIAYYADNVYTVVNVNYASRNGTNSQGYKYSMLMGYNPTFITDNKENHRYNPDYFIWFYDNAHQKWETPYTTDDSLLHPDNYIRVSSYTQLDPKNITDEYLRQFFGDYEQQYFSLKKMCGLTGNDITTTTYNNKNKASTLHLVLIANTYDPTIGTGCASDEINLKNEFHQVADALGVSFKQYIIDGSSFSKQNVVNTLNSLYPGSDDIVLFVYRGHGFRWKDQTSDWPRMDLRPSSYADITENSSMNLSEVYSMLKNKGARLNIILADCCNSEIDMSPVTNNNYLNFQFDNNSDVAKLKKLFLSSNGILLSAAAQKGEVSWTTSQGGLYSMSFLQALREGISYLSNDPCSWDNVISKTISLARNKSTPTFCSNCSLQDGIKYVSITGDY